MAGLEERKGAKATVEQKMARLAEKPGTSAYIGFTSPSHFEYDHLELNRRHVRERKSTVKKAGTAKGKAAKSPKPDADLLTGSSAPKEVTPTLESEIGAEIRRLRKRFDLTVSELSTASGISPGMLSKIENGTISPSLSTLSSLAKTLNVPMAHLFHETGEQRDCSFVKAGTGVRIERRGTKAGHLYDLLGHSLGGEVVVEPYLITLKSDAESYTDFRHAGVEFIYMLTGKVRYRHADRSYLMEPGDALFFDAAARHGPEELIKAPMTYLSIIVYPRQN